VAAEASESVSNGVAVSPGIGATTRALKYFVSALKYFIDTSK